MPQTVLITGASSGIGAATADLFAKSGWNVLATMRRPDRSPLARAPNLFVETLDVTDDASVSAAVTSGLSRFGAIDVLVNNAGFGPLGAVEQADTEQARRVLDTNALGPVRLAKAVLPSMRARKSGRIINVSSMGGEFTTPFGGVYHASKYALEALSDALRFEAAPFGVDVVVIQPGPVKTPMADAALESLNLDPAGPYHGRLTKLDAMSRRQFKSGTGMIEATLVARAIFGAATASKPRTRYKVGMMAHVFPGIRRMLPDRQWDGMWKSML